MSSAVLASANGVKSRMSIKHHGDFAAFTGEHIVTLLEQSGRQSWINVRAERGVKSSPLSQTGLHAVERGGQHTEVIILNHGQALAVVTDRNTFGAFGKVANRLEGRRKPGADGDRQPHAKCQANGDDDSEQGNLTDPMEHSRQHRARQGEDESDAQHEHVGPGGKSRARARQGITDPRITG
ncbi:hypothetical protein MMARE11_24590 [Mycobacterium marinum E11]|nr:hypothetical protein MMARE11_24590 [Mycobacterium marinum E11]